MPIVRTQMELSHVLANLALLDREHLVLVSKGPGLYLFINISGVIPLLIFHCFYIPSDVNECSANTHNCHSYANCKNTNGGFTCACKSGFSGSGTSCDGK